MENNVVYMAPVTEITISITEYNRLTQNDRFLGALEAAGVDNWDGYDYARELLEEGFE